MAQGQVNYNLDSIDDAVLPEMIPSFEGGQFSNVRANLLQPNQSKVLGNCDIDKLGKIRTRRGTVIIGKDGGAGPQPDPGVVSQIQGLTSYQTKDYNYIVAAHNKKIWKYTGNTTAPHTSGWEQIALGGIADQAEMLIYREGKIDRPYDGATTPVTPAGYVAGTTVLKVKEVGYVGTTPPPVVRGGIIGVGEKLYFSNNLRTEWYEYTVAAVSGGPPVTQITLEEPGLVFDVKDGWKFIVARPAKNVGAHLSPTGTPYSGTLTLTAYTGVVNTGEYFMIKSENRRYTVATHGEDGVPNTTTLTGAWGSLATDFVASSVTARVVFAQGNDKLFFTDGTGPIYAWDGTSLMNISAASTLDYTTGSILHQARTNPPQNVTVLLWFQNRLIASGISTEPDAIYFSDFFDGTSWDQDYQKVRIGGGESDPITGCLAWTDLNMLVFKKNSCYLINLDPSQNPTPEDPTLLVASFAVKQLHKLIGCPAPQTAIQVGGGSTTPGSDVFFVDGDKKVHSIRRVMAAETQQEVGQAMSLPIQDVLDSINIDHIDLACAMYHNEHYILAFPSIRGSDGGLRNNAVVSYNLLTQSWCGVWSWSPTCFARRTDLGSYSKLILGDYRIFPTGGGRVLQWMDDLSLEEETDTTYQELVNNAGVGYDIQTQILTRAFTGGDMYSFKTGLNVEFEFDESVAEAVEIKVVLDKVVVRDPTTGSDLIAEPFDTLSETRIRLGTPDATLPFRLPASPSLLRKAFDLQRYGTWRELQFQINAAAGKLAIRSIRITYFSDTMRLQSIPNTGVLEVPVDLPSFP